ncbi:hypothetical protein MaudMau93_004333 [Microsporum audouinii]
MAAVTKPANLASTMKSRLPVELWLRVFEEVSQLDEDAVKWQEESVAYLGLKSASRCCRFFYSLAAPIIHHTIVLEYSTGFGQGLLRVLNENSAIAQYIQAIILPEHTVYGRLYETPQIEILDQLRGKANLKEFRRVLHSYEDMNDRFVQRLLQYWPSCRLSIMGGPWSMWMLPNFQNREGEIYCSRSLVSLGYAWDTSFARTYADSDFDDSDGVEYSDDDDDDANGTTAAKILIRSCPNLEDLKLTQRTKKGRSKFLEKFTLGSSDRLPPLKKLELQFVYLLPGQGFLWSKCANWGRLQHLVLAIDSPREFIECFTGLVPNLSSFEIRVRSPIDMGIIAEPLKLFLKGIYRLRSFISFNVPKSVLPTLYTYHGNSLQTLKFRLLVVTCRDYKSIESDSKNPFPNRERIYEEEPSLGYPSTPLRNFVFYLSTRKHYAYTEIDRHLHAEDMENIRLWFPNVYDFAFDLDPRGCLPYDLLTSISRHQSLEHLQIHLPYNLEFENPPGEISFQKWIESIFSHIDSQKRDLVRNPSWPQGKVLEFKSLALTIGNWDKFDVPYKAAVGEVMYRCRRMPNGQIGKAMRYPPLRPAVPMHFFKPYSDSDSDSDSDSEDLLTNLACEPYMIFHRSELKRMMGLA